MIRMLARRTIPGDSFLGVTLLPAMAGQVMLNLSLPESADRDDGGLI
jgi:hypothetical protein